MFKNTLQSIIIINKYSVFLSTVRILKYIRIYCDPVKPICDYVNIIFFK